MLSVNGCVKMQEIASVESRKSDRNEAQNASRQL